MADPSTPRRSDDLRAWRRRATAVFWGLVGLFCVAATLQLIDQLFRPLEAPGPATCEEGIAALSEALERGWERARQADDGPERALDRFRAEVGPTWRALPAVQRTCGEGGEAAARLDALERLRYALESRVRVEGGSLAALRRRALGDPPGGPDAPGRSSP